MTDPAENTPEARPSRRRSGGRAARVALRSQPLDETMKPVRAGMPGGKYRPLSACIVMPFFPSPLNELQLGVLNHQPLAPFVIKIHFNASIAAPALEVKYYTLAKNLVIDALPKV